MFAFSELKHGISTRQIDVEFEWFVPAMVYLITDYTKSHREDGAWPPPGTISDSSAMPFLSSRVEGADRIDTYDTPFDGRQIDFALSPNGSIYAWVRNEER